ncbi:molecular chaperone DnaJ [Marivirga sp. S37H4]|uniref:Molecular chaperone DnaJ n=1 Tax=Marivirga aurantiaca TaxID=2802615 RepID=A0A934WW83_9BACT|nr:molecular chaperone DnaJ [Marivirga aurantiaca]MBK6264213.1 molecular chaperone DnaJ [Marivirga aurantiaca]
MKYIKYIFIALLSLGIHQSGVSQSNSNERVNYYYEKAQAEMKAGNYEEANLSFREILKSGAKLPAEMPYLFSETLYHVEQYQNSQSFLDKYFEIMGSAGAYYDNAVQLKKLLKTKLNKNVSCDFCDYSGYRQKTCTTCHGEKQLLKTCNYCEGVGKIGCVICSGDGVIIQLGAMGNKSYKTCHRCNGVGVHECPICEGEKEFYSYCPTCLGTGEITTSVICNHEPISK